MDRPLLRRRLRELCCGMDPIHPTAPTSSFSSSYCWYWSPVPRCWHEVSMLLMHGFATPGGSGHLILRSEVQSGRELQLLSLTLAKIRSLSGEAARKGDAFWCFFDVDPSFFLHARFFKSSPKSRFFCHSCLTLLFTCSDIPKGFLQTISSLNY